MTKTKWGGDAARDEARPTDAELARYQRSYRMTTDKVERFYWLWEEAMAHALLLEQDPERSYPEHGGLSVRRVPATATGVQVHCHRGT